MRNRQAGNHLANGLEQYETAFLENAIDDRTIAWLNRCRRLAKDCENFNRKGLAFLRLASIRPHAPKSLQSNLMFPDRL
jgi:hypothetical protein